MAGRKPKYQEFLQTLQEVTGTNVTALSKLLGKKQSNVSDYLAGRKRVHKGAIRSGLRHLSEWSVIADGTMLPLRRGGQCAKNLEFNSFTILPEVVFTCARQGNF